MISFVSHCLGWTKYSNATKMFRTYKIDASFCDVMLPRFIEDWYFTWRGISCTDIHAFVRTALDMWQHNSLVSFHEIETEDADITFRAETASSSQLAITMFGNETDATLMFNVDKCWYTDREFCAAVSNNIYPLLSSAIVSFISSTMVVTYNICNPINKLDSIVRLLSWTLLLSSVLSIVVIIFPCIRCRDFTTTVMHEAGHVIGIGHTDDPGDHYCGCGENVTLCSSSPSAVMFSQVVISDSLCLAQDDIDAVRSLYGGPCNDPNWCYSSVSMTGLSRFSMSLVYSFMIAYGVVLLRNLGAVVYRRSMRHRDRKNRNSTRSVKEIVLRRRNNPSA